MRAAVISEGGHIEVRDWPTPEPGPGEVLLRVDACGLCGTDQRVLRGEKAISVPIIGHEIAGTVAAVGSGVSGIAEGERYSPVTVIGCGDCPLCRANRQNLCDNTFKAIGYAFDGGFAEYMCMPADGVAQDCLIRIPDDMSSAVATMLEPLSCSVNGLRCMPIEEMEHVVVFGAGVIGVFNALVARARGAKRVTVMNRTQPRLDLLATMGLPIDDLVSLESNDPLEWIHAETEGRGADGIVLSASDKSLVATGISMLRRDGHLSIFAGFNRAEPIAPIDVNRIHYEELHVHGANSSVHRDYLEALAMLRDGRVNGEALITHTFPLEAFTSAVSTQADRAAGALKVIVEPGSTKE